VVLEDEDGNNQRYRIVGPDEFDPQRGYISMDSPIAIALMKKTVDDQITVMTPKGQIEMDIVSIDYEIDTK